MRIHTAPGSPAQRGRDHGHDLAPEIGAAIAALKEHLAASGHPPAALADRMMDSGLPRTAAQTTPDLWAEVTGIAEGSRIDLADVLLLTFLDEVWAMTSPRRPTSASAGCSVLARALSEGGKPGTGTSADRTIRTEVGQTMDLPAWADGRMIVLRVIENADATPSPRAPDVVAPTALVMAYPGNIGLCGANDAGLGVAVNALTHAPWSDSGLGVAFITRTLLTLRTLAAAEAFLVSIPHAAGQAYTIAAPDGIATFEADADGVRRVTPPDTTVAAHTNHRLGEPGARASESSRSRLDALQACIDRDDSLAEALSGDVVVDGTRWRDPHLTFGAFRAVGDEPAAHFADGPSLRTGHAVWSRVNYR